MSTHVTGLLLGGVCPAILLGVYAVLLKAGSKASLGLGPFLFLLGTSILAASGIAFAVSPGRSFDLGAGKYVVLAGLTWAASTALISYAISRHDMAISQLTPIFNTNTLVAVVLGLLIFAEWRDVHLVKLLSGTALIMLGGWLVSFAR